MPDTITLLTPHAPVSASQVSDGAAPAVPRFSVVIPTLNEVGNIDPLLVALFSQGIPRGEFEVIFVDDSSADGTREKIRAWHGREAVRLVEREGKADLTASIMAGVAVARGEVIVVMDADLSHPPERLTAVAGPVLDGSHDVAIGSRYSKGGGTEGWPLYRQLLSRAGGWIARPVCDVNDVTSGFFAFRKDLASLVTGRARGYKILFELLMAGQSQLRVTEVPICFRDRTRGSSKLSFSHQWTYLQRLMTLAGGTVSFGTAGRFAAVGLLGVVVDALILQWMLGRGADLAMSHIASFFVAATFNYLLNSKWSFRSHHEGYLHWGQFGRFLTVGLLALLLRGGVLALMIYGWKLPAGLAIFPAIAATALVNYLGSAFYVFPVGTNPPPLHIRWRVASVGVVIFIVALRLIYFSQAELIPDEAYYWQYTRHMDLSFFDHPPMVAWLIWLGTAVAGDNEFGVRIGAFVCGLVTMGYLYGLAYNLYDKSTAMRTVLLWAVLPLGFASGILMTPDAPLVAAWAATLYYMERALLANRSSAWLGMGIAFGAGILSKYTLGLLGPLALLFVILDPIARRWMARPHPYLAALLALILFSPVIIWNMENQFASFLFQTQRAGGINNQFSTHLLFLHILVLLTPVGVVAAGLALLADGGGGVAGSHEQRRRLFIRVFGGGPLVIFMLLSMSGSPKFHWTGPVWLVVLPAMAWMMGQADLKGLARRVQNGWKPTVVASMFLYALLLHYVVLGIPGVPYHFFTEHYFWRQTTQEIEQVVEAVQRNTGKKPLVVGMSKWSVASALAFYDSKEDRMDIRSRNLFGDSGSMYDFWYPAELPTDRPVILVGMSQEQVERNRQGHDLGQMLVEPGPVEYRTIVRDDKPLRKVYYRIAQGYTGNIDKR